MKRLGEVTIPVYGVAVGEAIDYNASVMGFVIDEHTGDTGSPILVGIMPLNEVLRSMVKETEEDLVVPTELGAVDKFINQHLALNAFTGGKVKELTEMKKGGLLDG